MRSMSISPSARGGAPRASDLRCASRPKPPRPVQPPLRSLRGGFTLLEVMIAMAILAISLVAVYQSQSQSVSMAANSRFLTTASLLAQSRMAALDAAVPREVVSGNGGFGDDVPDYLYQLEVTDVEGFEHLKKIALTVTNRRMAAHNAS